jgi:hypothetical protein
MTKQMFARMLTGLALGAAMFLAHPGQAGATPQSGTAVGYVCEASLEPQNNSFYGDGYGRVLLTALPECQGSTIGEFFMTTGGSAPGLKFTPEEMHANYQALQGAASSGRQVRIRYTGDASTSLIVSSATITARR